LKEILVDIETYSEVDIGKCGLYRYATDPSFEILLIAWATDEGAGFGETKCADLASGETIPMELLEAFQSGSVRLIAHNAAFERVCFSVHLNRHYPGQYLKPISCDLMLSDAMSKKAYELTGLENPNSVSQLKTWLEERGIPMDTLGKKDVAQMITELDKNGVDAEALDMLKLRLQMAKSSVKKYQAAERCVCPDGRARGLFQFYGASRTGRYSGRNIQLQNLPQNHISTLDEARTLVKLGCFDMVESIYGNTPDVLSQLIRTMLIPKDGCEFIVADFSAIEARVLEQHIGIRHYEGTPDGERMKELGEISLRMVKILLENGSLEVLATNLSQTEFHTEEIKELYHMRWGIETAYETLKSRLQLENFTGTKPILLLQDIYSTIYLSNLAEDIILDTERELDQKEANRKHKMMINQTVSIGILKNDLIYILLETDDQKKNILFQQIYEDISKNLVPVRPDRHYTRTKGRLAGKYSNTHKRAY